MYKYGGGSISCSKTDLTCSWLGLSECVFTISDRRKSIDDQFENLNNAVQRLDKSQQNLIEKVENLSAPVGSVSRSVGAFMDLLVGFLPISHGLISHTAKRMLLSRGFRNLLTCLMPIKFVRFVNNILIASHGLMLANVASLEIILRNYSVSVYHHSH